MKYKWRRICAITGIYPFSLLNIPAVSIVQDWENGLSVNDSSDMIENLDPDRLEEVVGLVLEVVFRL